MKRFYIYILCLIFLEFNLYSQSIRKNYLEMTDTEKISLVNAFYQLRTGSDLMNDIANYHADFFSFDNTGDPTQLDIHLNLPDEPERDIFLAWHRRLMFELEQAMQDIDPNLTLPYWDSSTDQSVNSSLWDQNFMGQFDIDWNLGRAIGNFGSLPTQQEINNIQSNSAFLTYSNNMERGTPHAGAHRWVGGVMRTSFSPRDPVFFLHHNYVDKLWNDWQQVNVSSSYSLTSMIRYDGTYVFNGQTLPSVNPNDIIDSKSLGVFFAENQLVQLEDYTVSNTYNNQENFYYQFRIQSGNNFNVPVGTDCKFESVNEIILQPGFTVEPGASFTAKIDNQNSNKSSLERRSKEIVSNQIPYDYVGEMENIIFNEIDLEDRGVAVLKSFPNPFLNKITIQLSDNLNQGKVIIFDMMGKRVKEEEFNDTDKVEISNLYGLPVGVYVLQVVDNNSKILIVRRLIKM